MASKWSKFSKEELEVFVKESYSLAAVAEKVGYGKSSGSANKAIKDMIAYYGFDSSHFTGQAWNKENYDYTRFQYGVKLKHALNPIIALRGHKCENCNLETWLDKPISLEIHHLDGNNLNNVLENIQLLCPNCHSYTENWRGKNIKGQGLESVSEEEFVGALQESPNIRQALISLGLTAAGANYVRANELIIKYQIAHLIK